MRQYLNEVINDIKESGQFLKDLYSSSVNKARQEQTSLAAALYENLMYGLDSKLYCASADGYSPIEKKGLPSIVQFSKRSTNHHHPISNKQKKKDLKKKRKKKAFKKDQAKKERNNSSKYYS